MRRRLWDWRGLVGEIVAVVGAGKLLLTLWVRKDGDSRSGMSDEEYRDRDLV